MPARASIRVPFRTSELVSGRQFWEHSLHCLNYRQTDSSALFFSFYVDVFVLTHVIWAILSRLDSSNQQQA